jgi:hypothetical protein
MLDDEDSHHDSGPDSETSNITFSLQLIIRTPTTLKGGKKSKTQSKKDIITKEMVFGCSYSNYTLFLRRVLEKYDQKYTVTSTNRYRFKYYHQGRA